MKVHRVTTRPSVLAAGLLLISPLLALAAPPGNPGAPNMACGGPEEHGLPALPPGFPPPGAGPLPGGPGPLPGFGPEWGAPPPFLHGLKLTEEQQDKVFSILYAAAPAVHEQEKALHKAHEAIAQLGTSADYDDSRAKTLVETASKAGGQLALLRLRTEHDIYAILTPEQRTQLAEHRQHGPGGHEGAGSHEAGKPR